MEILTGDDQRCNSQWLREQCLTRFGKHTLTAQLTLLLQPTANSSTSS
jgi:hypothetical protein